MSENTLVAWAAKSIMKSVMERVSVNFTLIWQKDFPENGFCTCAIKSGYLISKTLGSLGQYIQRQEGSVDTDLLFHALGIREEFREEVRQFCEIMEKVKEDILAEAWELSINERKLRGSEYTQEKALQTIFSSKRRTS